MDKIAEKVKEKESQDDKVKAAHHDANE